MKTQCGSGPGGSRKYHIWTTSQFNENENDFTFPSHNHLRKITFPLLRYIQFSNGFPHLHRYWNLFSNHGSKNIFISFSIALQAVDFSLCEDILLKIFDGNRIYYWRIKMFKRCRCSLTCSEYFSNALINGLVTSSLEQANAVKEKFCRFGETHQSCGHNYGYRVFTWKLRNHTHSTEQPHYMIIYCNLYK